MRQPNLHVGNTPHRVAFLDAARDGRVRRRVIDIYARAASDWAQAAAATGRSLRGARELRSHERRFVAEAVYGMIRARRRLAFACGREDPLALYLAWLDGEFASPAALDEELLKAGVARTQLSSAKERLAAITDERERLAVAESVPDWLVARLADERGLDDTARLLAAMNRRAPLSVRANRLKNSRDELAQRLLAEGVASRPSPLATDGLELDTHLNAYGLAAFKEGRFELQDAGSQLIAELTAPPPRGLVLDACAGAGGKTLALGALLENRGRLLASDVSEKKLEELRDRARRAGLTNVRAVAVPGEEENAPLPDALAHQQFDRVLCDAPCSGLGVLRRNPEARWRLSASDVDELSRTQRRILATYAPLVAPGGRLIYATCTVTAVENDEVVKDFLAAHPSFEEVPAREILGGERARAIGDGVRLRLLPHVHDTDGFFAAVLRRSKNS